MGSLGILLCLAFVNQVIAAVNFVFPFNSVSWTTTGPNNISWTYDAGTPPFVNFQLLHNDVGSFQPIQGLLQADGTFATGVDVTNKVMFIIPACMPGSPSLPIGYGYSLRVYSEIANLTQTTLGTSNGTFSIVAGTAVCPTPGNGTSPSSVSTGLTSTATISNSLSSPSKSRAGAIAGGIIGGIFACVLAVTAAWVYNRHRRSLRRRTTMQFVRKKGLVVGKPVDSKDVEMHGRF